MFGIEFNLDDRAVVINALVKKGDNVLITGIGGGVALIALQLCVALGANVYVSSGNEEKIRKAVSLGAKGGVNYKAGEACLYSGPAVSDECRLQMTGPPSWRLCSGSNRGQLLRSLPLLTPVAGIL